MKDMRQLVANAEKFNGPSSDLAKVRVRRVSTLVLYRKKRGAFCVEKLCVDLCLCLFRPCCLWFSPFEQRIYPLEEVLCLRCVLSPCRRGS